MRIFISNLPPQTEETEVLVLFRQYGAVTSVKLVSEPLSGKGLGYGFVEMSRDHEALDAIQSLDGLIVSGKVITVKESNVHLQPSGNKPAHTTITD
jgi:RNA recognition motif-containing protein